jgi:hypothetical protein
MAKAIQMDLFDKNVLKMNEVRTNGWVHAGTIAEGLIVRIAQHCNIPREWIVDDVKEKMAQNKGELVLRTAKKIFQERNDAEGMKQIREIELAHMQ